MRLSSINKPVIRFLLTLIVTMICQVDCFGQSSPAKHQTRTSISEQLKMVRLITAHYTQWQTVELNGSLQADKLLINPSVRIFMERNSMVQISVRAPFVGEAVRIDVTNDSIIAVNKLKHVYFAESLADVLADMPVNCGALQNLLLRRVFLPDGNPLSADNYSGVNISKEDDCWLIVPVDQPMNGEIQYGFMADDNGVLGATYFTTEDAMHTALCEYFDEKGKTLIDLTVESNSKVFFAGFNLNEPKWNASPMKPVQIKGNYRRVYSVGEFVKSF